MRRTNFRMILRDTAIGIAGFVAIGAFQLWNLLTPALALAWIVMAVCFSFCLALIIALGRKARRHREDMQRVINQYPPNPSLWRYGPPHPFARWPRRPPKPD